MQLQKQTDSMHRGEKTNAAHQNQIGIKLSAAQRTGPGINADKQDKDQTQSNQPHKGRHGLFA